MQPNHQNKCQLSMFLQNHDSFVFQHHVCLALIFQFSALILQLGLHTHKK